MTGTHFISQHRAHSIYHSDQLDILVEEGTFVLGLLTDNIAVVQEYDCFGSVLVEYEIMLFKDRKANEQFLLNYLPFIPQIQMNMAA